MKKLKIFWKLLLSIFLVSALSILSFGVVFYHYQKQALIERTIDQLKSVNILKKQMILKRLKDDEDFFKHFIHRVILPENGEHETPLQEFFQHRNFLKDFCQDYGHLNVILLDKHNKVIAHLYDSRHDSLKYSFMRSFQIENCEYKIGLVTSTSYLETLLFERTGMGKTGESYLVLPDRRLITKSRFFPDTCPLQILANTKTIEAAFKGNDSSSLSKDYRNIKVLSAYTRIEHAGISWALVSEMDLSEAMQAVGEMRTLTVYIGILILLVALLVTLYLSQYISKPSTEVSFGIDAISNGIIPKRMSPPFYNNEQGQMKLALNRLIDSFEKITSVATEIGRGNLNVHFKPFGSYDQLTVSLLNMQKQLENYRAQEEQLNKQKALILLEGQENERRRIARDLHDGLGQWLTGLKLKIASVEMPEDQKAELKALTSETIEEVRRITNNLMPSVLVDFGLDAALRQLTISLQKTTKMSIQYLLQKEATTLKAIPFEVNITLYRIVQEALNNIAKHAEANFVTICLTEKQHEMALEIKDDGKGFVVDDHRKKGNGLGNMNERVRLLNGTFAIQSTSEGTQLQITIPLV